MNEKLIKQIIKQFPGCRHGVVKAMIDGLELHSRKHQDYNSDKYRDLYKLFGIQGTFFNIWRKIIRLYNGIIQKKDLTVNESLSDTAIDLLVYAAMLVDELREEQKHER